MHRATLGEGLRNPEELKESCAVEILSSKKGGFIRNICVYLSHLPVGVFKKSNKKFQQANAIAIVWLYAYVANEHT